MRSNTLINWAGCVTVLALLLLACGPKRRVVSSGGSETRVSAAAKRVVMGHVAQRQQHYTTFNGRARSNLTIDGKKRYDVVTNVRIVHDEAIWISVTAIMGIEAARILITPDSMSVINRLTSEYIRKPFAYLGGFTGNSVDFTTLERLLTGNVVDQLAGADLEVWQAATGYTLQRLAGDLHYVVRVGNDYRNRYTSIGDSVRGQQLEAHYSDYRTTDGYSFPNQLEMAVATPQLTLQASMTYSRIVYDGKVELPFRIPSRYTEIQ